MQSRKRVSVVKARWRGRVRTQGDFEAGYVCMKQVLCLQAGVCVEFCCAWLMPGRMFRVANSECSKDVGCHYMVFEATFHV